MNLLSFGVITAYVVILFYYINDTDYTKMLGLTLLTALIICQLKNTNVVEGATCGVKPPEPVEAFTNGNANTNTHSGASADVVDNGNGEMPKTKLIKQKKSKIAELDLKYKIGPYDGLCLSQEKDMNELVENNMLMNYLGVQGPVQNIVSDNSFLTGPPVDGDADSPQRMFMLANNSSSLNCCPSTFSTSTGCVCTTEKQRDYVNRRGHNRSGPGNF